MANVHGQIAFKPLDPEVTEDFYTWDRLESWASLVDDPEIAFKLGYY